MSQAVLEEFRLHVRGLFQSNPASVSKWPKGCESNAQKSNLFERPQVRILPLAGFYKGVLGNKKAPIAGGLLLFAHDLC